MVTGTGISSPPEAARRRVSPELFRRTVFATLVSLVVIVIFGVTVRLTGSGLGCSDWPTCEQNRVVPEVEFHALIEFINRLVTGPVSLLVCATLVGSYLRSQRRADLTRLSWGLVVGVAANIPLGRLVVITDLNPWVVLGHFGISMGLIANAVVLLHRAGLEDERVKGSSATAWRPQAWVISALTAVAIFTGMLVTGSGPHSGNRGEVFIERLPFDVPDIARVHGISVVALLTSVLVTLWWLRSNNAPAVEQRRLRIVLSVLLAQGAIGYLQYFTGVPALLVGMHVLGACVLLIAVVWFHVTSAPDPIERSQELRLPASPLVHNQTSLVQP